MPRLRFAFRTPSGPRGPSLAGRIFQTLFGIPFAAAGVAFLVVALKTTVADWATYRWIQTPAVIEKAEVVKKNDGYGLDLRYRYHFGGQPYTHTAYTRQPYATDKVSKADAVARRLMSNPQRFAFVNPAQPQEAILQRPNRAGGLGMALFASVFVCIGFGVMISAWRRKSPTDAPAKPAGPRTRPGGIGGMIAVHLFCGVFIAVGLIVPYFTFVRPLMEWRAARHWQAVPAVVVESEVRTHQGDDSTTYSAYIAYRFDWRGQPVLGDRYTFTSVSSSNHGAAAQRVAEYPSGRAITVYVDPEDPDRNVIFRAWTPSVWLGLIPIVFALFGGLFLFLFRRSQRGTSQSRKGRGRTRQKTATLPPPEAPLILRVRGRVVGRILGMIAIAAFWNGIVSVFLFQVVREWSQGRAPWGLTLFLLPFVLIGLLLLGGVVHAFLRAFNPRPTLVLSTSRLFPGARAELQWILHGNTYRLQSLQIFLTGREEATYRRGTDTHTDKHMFYRKSLVALTDPARMAQGSVPLVLPENTMPTWAASNNKIVWQLEVEGSIRRWPDVKEAFPIVVLPREEEVA